MQPKTKINNFPGHDHSGTHIFLITRKTEMLPGSSFTRNLSKNRPRHKTHCTYIYRSAARTKIFREFL